MMLTTGLIGLSGLCILIWASKWEVGNSSELDVSPVSS